MATHGLPLRFSGPFVGTNTNFFQGALGAGGYGSSLIMASDGSAMALRNDTALPWLWSRSTNKWTNAAKTPGMNTIQAGTPNEMVFAPSNPNIMYLVYPLGTPVHGTHGGDAVSRYYLWKSTDKGVTWTQPNSTAISGGNLSVGGDAVRFCGPRMAVDPNNADVVYLISMSGIVYVSYDGGTTLSVITGLLAALPSGVINGSAPTAGGNSFTLASNPIDGLASNGYCAFDPSWPLALGTNGQDDVVGFSSGSTIGVQVLQAQNGGTGATTIQVGDTVYFGRAGAICVDGSSDTIANPGGSGLISKYVYVSWGTATNGIWRTTNGGVSWGQMTGGPTHVGGKMKMSNDGTLAGGGFNTNILYITDLPGTSVWRYVENPPTGSGLSSATWTHAQGGAGLTATILSIAPSPTTAGKIAAINIGGGIFLSTNFGTSYTQANDPLGPGITFVEGPPGISPNGTDTPWLIAFPDISTADCEYDRGSGSVANKLWLSIGVGVFYAQPTAFTSGVTVSAITKDATGAVVTLGSNDWNVGECFIPTGVGGMTQANGTRFFIQSIIGGGQVKTNVDSSAFSNFTSSGTAGWGNIFTTQSEVMDSLTSLKIVKTPTPNGRILMCCQDRQLFSIPNVTTYPTTYFPLGLPSNPNDITYSKSAPLVCWGATTSNVSKSTDGGVTWAATTLSQGWCSLASISALNCVAVTRPGTINIQVTTDGGTTWNDCLFAGSPLAGNSPAPFQGGVSYWVVCDDFGNYYYWDHGTAKFWKSTDGGANFTLQSTTAFNPSTGGSTAEGSTFCCPPGVNGDLWFCPGNTGGYTFKVIGYYSHDSGQTWTAMNQAGDPQNLFHLAFGASKPGGTGYPAAFMTGFMTDPSTSGMWRCDDPLNAARVWTAINGFRNVNPEIGLYLNADTETYGTVYQAQASTGYIYGKLG